MLPKKEKAPLSPKGRMCRDAAARNTHEAEARGEVEPGPEGHVAEVRLKPPPRVEDDGGGAMLPSLGTRLPKHGSASVLRGSRLRCTGE